VDGILGFVAGLPGCVWQFITRLFKRLIDRLLDDSASGDIDQSAVSSRETTQQVFKAGRDVYNLTLILSPETPTTSAPDRSLVLSEDQMARFEPAVSARSLIEGLDIDALLAMQEQGAGPGTADPRRLLEQPTSSSASYNVRFERFREEEQEGEASGERDESTPRQLRFWDGPS